jgi:hypothetical protein
MLCMSISDGDGGVADLVRAPGNIGKERGGHSNEDEDRSSAGRGTGKPYTRSGSRDMIGSDPNRKTSSGSDMSSKYGPGDSEGRGPGSGRPGPSGDLDEGESSETDTQRPYGRSGSRSKVGPDGQPIDVYGGGNSEDDGRDNRGRSGSRSGVGPDGRLLGPDGRSGSKSNLDADGRPLGADGRPLGADGRPLGADGRPLGADGRPLGADGRPLGADGRPLGADIRPLGADGRPLGADGRPLGADGGPLGADGRPLGADGRPLGADKRPLGADGRPLGADGGPVGADGRPLGADGRPLGADGRPLGADGRPLKDGTARKGSSDSTGYGNPASTRKGSQESGPGLGQGNDSRPGFGRTSSRDELGEDGKPIRKRSKDGTGQKGSSDSTGYGNPASTRKGSQESDPGLGQGNDSRPGFGRTASRDELGEDGKPLRKGSKDGTGRKISSDSTGYGNPASTRKGSQESNSGLGQGKDSQPGFGRTASRDELDEDGKPIRKGSKAGTGRKDSSDSTGYGDQPSTRKSSLISGTGLGRGKDSQPGFGRTASRDELDENGKPIRKGSKDGTGRKDSSDSTGYGDNPSTRNSGSLEDSSGTGVDGSPYCRAGSRGDLGSHGRKGSQDQSGSELGPDGKPSDKRKVSQDLSDSDVGPDGNGCDPNRVEAYGDGLKRGICDEPNTFTIETKNAGAGSLGLAIEGPAEALMNCEDNNDGTATVEYVPPEEGDYNIIIQFGDEDIAGSPFKVSQFKILGALVGFLLGRSSSG